MINYKDLKKKALSFMRLTGITIEKFEEIVEKVRPKWEKMVAQKKMPGRKSHLETLEDEVLCVLIYYRFYVTHMFLGHLFNLDASNICRHMKKMEPLLAGVLGIRKDRSMSQEDLMKVIVDVTEVNTQRPKKNQRESYSGKKKRHTAKIEVQIDETGKIINVSRVYGGRKHDFAIRKLEKPMPRKAVKLADSGYQGLQRLTANVVLPYKRKKKTPLSDSEKEHNRSLSSQRVLIENVFAKLKKFKILGSQYRNFQKKLHLRFNIIAGIHNLCRA